MNKNLVLSLLYAFLFSVAVIFLLTGSLMFVFHILSVSIVFCIKLLFTVGILFLLMSFILEAI